MSRTPSPFRFVVADLLREPGRRRSEHIEKSVSWGVELSRVLDAPPLSGEVTFEGAVGGVFATGSASVVVEHTCHRCTATWTERMEVAFREMLDRDPETDYSLDGEIADLEAPLRDAVLLALPLLPTCRPECLGLCARCGADLNTGACPGHDEEPTSPFSGLREMLES